MKTLNPEIANHLNNEVTTLCICWKITLKSGQVSAYTNHDQNIVVDGLSYKSTSGFSSSGIPSNLDMAVNSIDVTSFLDDENIREEDVLAGVYDDARIEVFKVNWQDTSAGKIVQQVGTLGETEVEGEILVVEVRGRMQDLKRPVGQLYSPNCRAFLGDNKCKVNLDSYKRTGSISAVSSNKVFTSTNLGQASGYFKRGLIRWTSGKNAGLTGEVKNNSSNQLELVLNMVFPVEVGDAFEIFPGCDKSLATCKNRYNNVVNFRGEPFIPSMSTSISPVST